MIFGALQVTKVLSTEEAKRAIEGSGKDFGKSRGKLARVKVGYQSNALPSELRGQVGSSW